MTIVKQIVLYLLLIVLSFFTASFILERFLDGGLEGILYLFIPIFAITIYGIYAIIHPIFKKILPVHTYRENKPVKLIIFFLIYTIGWTLLYYLFVIGISLFIVYSDTNHMNF